VRFCGSGQVPLDEFSAWLGSRDGVRFDSYERLWQWSVDDVERFWARLVEFYELPLRGDLGKVRTAGAMPRCVWFPDAYINWAEVILTPAVDQRMKDRPAIIGYDENLTNSVLTWAQLSQQVASLAAALRDLGVAKGDVVAGVLTNCPETVVSLLATACIGAVWAVCSPEYGYQGVVNRMGQLSPKVLIGVDAYEYGGHRWDQRGQLERVADALPSLRTKIVVSRTGNDTSWEGWSRFTDLVTDLASPCYANTAFNDPLWVLFTSGTSGQPKGIVHTHGGMVLEGLKTNSLHRGLTPGDRYYAAGNTSWVIWNQLVLSMLTGATIVTYDGSPKYPDVLRHFEVLHRAEATAFFVGSAYLHLVYEEGVHPARQYGRGTLSQVFTSGSVFRPAAWRWLQTGFGDDVRVTSESGGTEVASAFIGPNAWTRPRPGVIDGPMLATDVQVWDDSGHQIRDRMGELVIVQAMPSMPVELWGDEDGTAYLSTYFSRFPGTWLHGDWATRYSHGGFVVHGRSDATLNKNGVRVGTAEVYNALTRVREIRDSLIVGIELEDGEYFMPLFVALAAGSEWSEGLFEEVITRIRADASRHHLPDVVVPVPAIPVGKTGKKLDILVKRILLGRVHRGDAVCESASDPDDLDWFFGFASRLRSGWRPSGCFQEVPSVRG